MVAVCKPPPVYAARSIRITTTPGGYPPSQDMAEQVELTMGDLSPSAPQLTGFGQALNMERRAYVHSGACNSAATVQWCDPPLY